MMFKAHMSATLWVYLQELHITRVRAGASEADSLASATCKHWQFKIRREHKQYDRPVCFNTPNTPTEYNTPNIIRRWKFYFCRLTRKTRKTHMKDWRFIRTSSRCRLLSMA